jgi:DNA mismatch repair protein MSH6
MADLTSVTQVLENTDGGAAGSLLSALDMCTTVMGKRRLRAWLCRPLARIPDITARQDAVEELMGPAGQAAQTARDALSGGV